MILDAYPWIPVSIYAAFVLAYLAYYAWTRMDESVGRRPFVTLVILTELLLFADFYSRFEIFDWINPVSIESASVINFILLPAVAMEWTQFILGILPANERVRMRLLTRVLGLIAGVGIIVALFSPVTSWVFYYDANNVYHRGPLFVLPALTVFIVFVVTDIFLFTQVRSQERYSILMLAAYPIPVVIGAILAVFVLDVPWMPLGYSVATFALFAHMQGTGMGRDFLTGLYNRRRVTELMAERANRVEEKHHFAGIMIDVDNFKRINDTLGHSVGDVALADTAQLLSRSVRSGDVVARFGGDEFFVLLDIGDKAELEDVINRIEEEEARFSSEDHVYKLRLSKGYDIYDSARFDGIKDFVNHLDMLMYENKKQHYAQEIA